MSETESSFEIVQHAGILEEGNGGWNVELNLVSWYDKEPGWDIRAWNQDHTKCGKGIRLSNVALKNLSNIINNMKDVL